MAGLLEGQYQNVAVEADPDLEAALRAAVREGGELADILARLQQELGLGGGTLTLRGLSGGRQGEHAVELATPTRRPAKPLPTGTPPWPACPPTGSTPLKLPWSRPRAAITSRGMST